MSNYSLSNVWRESKSQDPGTELANILGAARVMAQTLVPKVEVRIAGMRTGETDLKTISVSARRLGADYPVPGEKLDEFLGVVVHEAGHCLFSKDLGELKREVYPKLHIYSSEFSAAEHLILTIEDIYINHILTAFPAYHEYLKRTINGVLDRVDLSSVFEPLAGMPTRKEMLDALIYVGSTGKIPDGISQESTTVLSGLLRHISQFCAGKLGRKRCIINCWKELGKLPVSKPPPPKQDKGEKSPQSEGKPNESDQGQSEPEVKQPEPPKTKLDDKTSLVELLNKDITDKVELPDDVAEQVCQAVVEKRQDLSQMVSALAGQCGKPTITFMPDEDAAEVLRCREKTAPVEQELRRIFQDFRLKRTEYYRGLYSGKVSVRRLHRAGYGDPRVFQRREKPEEMDIAVCLVMDMSSSVSRYRELIDEITVALSDAFTKEKATFIAVGYSSRRETINLARLYDQEVGKVCLGTDKLWDCTPSCEGLSAAVAQLARLAPNKLKLLIHFTDGRPNDGNMTNIPDVLKQGRAMGIEDYHVALGQDAVKYCRNSYGDRVMAIDKVEELPGVIEDILRTKLEVRDV